MRIFMSDDAVIKIPISLVRSRDSPEVHLHTTIYPIGRGIKIGIVGAPSILRIGIDKIITQPSSPTVIILKISTGFIKTKFP